MATSSHLPRPWHLAEIAVQTAPRVLLHGLPGTGKTHATLTLSHPAGAVALEDILSLTLHDDAAVSDLIGGYLPIAGKWSWRDGPAVQAWRISLERPVRLVLNEVDQAAGPVHTALLAILDDPASARLTLPTGETLTPNPENLQCVATMNGVPADLSRPLLDRFDGMARLDEPHPASIAALPADLQEAAAGLTTAAARSESRGTTPRDWHALAALLARGLDREDAAELVWAERASDVLEHMALLKVPARPAEDADEDASDVCGHCGTRCDEDDNMCSDRIRENAYSNPHGTYYCPNSGTFFDSDEDADGDVWSPDAGCWHNESDAQRWAINVRNGNEHDDGMGD